MEKINKLVEKTKKYGDVLSFVTNKIKLIEIILRRSLNTRKT